MSVGAVGLQSRLYMPTGWRNIGSGLARGWSKLFASNWLVDYKSRARSASAVVGVVVGRR